MVKNIKWPINLKPSSQVVRSDHHEEKQPPDLEALLSSFLKKLFAKSSKTSFSKSDGIFKKERSIGPIFILVVVVVVWFLSGIFIVSPVEEAVVLRFGRYVKTLDPGPHWLPTFIAKPYRVNVQRAGAFSYSADMLTEDENIAYVSLSVQFRVNDAKKFLFNVDEPIVSLQQATASALRQIVGHTKLGDLLTVGRATVRDQVEEQINRILDQYGTGLLVIDVNLQLTKPPEEVRGAFDDAIKAREDKQRYINQAQTYQKRIVPVAKGRAGRILRAAEARKEQLVLKAKADIADYLALLPEYQRNTKLIANYLMFETVEHMLQNSKKVWLDSSKGKNLFYVPLNQLLTPDATVHTRNLDADLSLPPVSDMSGGQSAHTDKTASLQSALLSPYAHARGDLVRGGSDER